MSAADLIPNFGRRVVVATDSIAYGSQGTLRLAGVVGPCAVLVPAKGGSIETRVPLARIRSVTPFEGPDPTPRGTR